MKEKVGNINIAYDCYGQGKEVWLVMHGNRDKRDYMRPYAKAIAMKPNRTVYNIDLRGHGESSKPGYKYNLQMFLDDVESFLSQKKIERVSIMGHSFGATLALSLCRNPRLTIDKLILLAASAYFTPNFRPKNLDNFKKLSIEEIHNRARMVMFSHNYPEVGDRVIDHWSQTPKAIHESLLGVKHPDLRKDIKQITAPTLLIYGEKDKLTPVEDGLLIHEKITNSKMKVIPNCSHFLILENISRIVEEIEGFV